MQIECSLRCSGTDNGSWRKDWAEKKTDEESGSHKYAIVDMRCSDMNGITLQGGRLSSRVPWWSSC
jgi:hypothetical protein